MYDIRSGNCGGLLSRLDNLRNRPVVLYSPVKISDYINIFVPDGLHLPVDAQTINMADFKSPFTGLPGSAYTA